MFNSLALTLLAAALATSAVPQPQDHSSEQAEAQISGARRLPLSHYPLPYLFPTPPRPILQIPILNARCTATLPLPRSSVPNSPQYGSPRRYLRATRRPRPCGPASRAAYRISLPKGNLTGALSAWRTMGQRIRTAVSITSFRLSRPMRG
jgi:hypothetical protein